MNDRRHLDEGFHAYFVSMNDRRHLDEGFHAYFVILTEGICGIVTLERWPYFILTIITVLAYLLKLWKDRYVHATTIGPGCSFGESHDQKKYITYFGNAQVLLIE